VISRFGRVLGQYAINVTLGTNRRNLRLHRRNRFATHDYTDYNAIVAPSAISQVQVFLRGDAVKGLVNPVRQRPGSIPEAKRYPLDSCGLEQRRVCRGMSLDLYKRICPHPFCRCGRAMN
jgi:hypothetical protein